MGNSLIEWMNILGGRPGWPKSRNNTEGGKQESATRTVLEQAEALSSGWAT